MAERVLCPYCGAEMRFIRSIGVHMYKCDSCFSFSPAVWHGLEDEAIREAAKKATELALKRYEPIKPLSFEEIANGTKFYFESSRVNGIMGRYEAVEYKPGDTAIACVECSGKGVLYKLVGEYGAKWRGWAEKPSEADRAAAKWEE